MPGAGKQPPEVQNQIKELLEAGFDPTTIHRRLKVGRSSIYRMKRCLQQHGTAYMPPELNKKNGRPKVLTAEQELDVRDWLRDPKNRNRYLDDLVWLIHDRFGIVCSTTTMSKLKRKWLHVIESEETGEPLDTATREWVMETHPHLPLLHQDPTAGPYMMQPHSPSQMMHTQQPPPPNEAIEADDTVEAAAQAVVQHQQQFQPSALSSHLQTAPQPQGTSLDFHSPHVPGLDPRFHQPQSQQQQQQPHEQQQQHIATQLEQELRQDLMGSAEASRA